MKKNDTFNTGSYCYNLYSPRPDYGSKPTFYHDDKVPATGFTSLYKVTHETAYAIEQAGTTKGFKGVVWSDKLWLDVDGYDKCEAVEQRLKEMGYEYISYDTGGRGGHFAIVRVNNPSHLLPLQEKQWVQEHFPEADPSIYTHLHPFRLSGTIHSSTGGRKSQVGGASGRALQLPVYSDKKDGNVSAIYKCFEGSSGHTGDATPGSIFDNFFIQRNTQEIPKQGERHETLIRLIYALRDAGYSQQVAHWWVSEANKRWAPPKEDHEIEKALQSIYR